MKSRHVFFCIYITAIHLFLLTGCDLEKEIDVPLPAYESKLVVEYYLETGKHQQMSVSESVSYFAGPRLPNVSDADVHLTYGSRSIRLFYSVEVDTVFRKAYNYVSSARVPANPDLEYSLQVKDSKGRLVTGKARFMPKVLIKSVEWKYNEDSLAFLLIKFDDDPLTENYYRLQVHRDSLSTNAEVDFNLDDSFKTGDEITLGTGYNFEKGEQVYITLFHIEKSYFDFLESVSSAANANGNPFAQPAKVQSTVEGGVGVFATLVYDRKKVIIE